MTANKAQWWVTGAEVVALLSLLALGFIIAFDANFVVFDRERFDLRPHHGLALAGIVPAMFVFGAKLFAAPVGGPGKVWRITQVRVIGALMFAQASLLVASYFAPIGSIVHQRTLDVSIVFAVAATTVLIARRPRFRTAILISLALGMAAAAIVALVAFSTSSDFLLGDRYRGQVTLLGDEQRLTRPFSHANIAAMFFAPSAAAMLALGAFTRGRKRLLVVAMAAVLTALTVLTASRAGVVSLVAGAAVLLWVLGRAATPWILAGLVLGLVFGLPPSAAVRDRVSGSDRYAATVVGPANFTLAGTTTVSVFIRNDSSEEWPATGTDSVKLTARWRDLDQEREWITQVWPIPATLAPGESANVLAIVPLDVPDGTYLAAWDLLIDREAFFLESQGRQALTRVEVVGSQASLPSAPVARARLVPGRARIWGWALELFAERPWFGHGVGMMRFVVNDVVDDPRPVAVSHAHNIALEPLAGWGLVGAVPFLSLLGLIGLDIAMRIRRVGPVGVVVGIALFVMLIHGLVEWPFMFPPLAALFAISAGLWFNVRQDVVIT